MCRAFLGDTVGPVQHSRTVIVAYQGALRCSIANRRPHVQLFGGVVERVSERVCMSAIHSVSGHVLVNCKSQPSN